MQGAGDRMSGEEALVMEAAAEACAGIARSVVVGVKASVGASL